MGKGVDEDELKFDLIALFEGKYKIFNPNVSIIIKGNPVNDQVIEILEDDTRLLQFDLDVLEGNNLFHLYLTIFKFRTNTCRFTKVVT